MVNKKEPMVEFKSVPKYYHDEQADRKCNTIREIDWDDERFSLLNLMRNRDDYGFIRIRCTEDCNGQPLRFWRRITNVAIWRNLMIISWKPDKLSQ